MEDFPIAPPQTSADHTSTSTESDVEYSYTRAQPGMEEWMNPNLEDFDRLTYLNVSVGQRFKQGRFVIVRKLGWGSFGTVWLARDRKEDNYVALKILTSEATGMCKMGSSDELAYAQQIVDWGPPGDSLPPWTRHIGRCLEVFEHATGAQVAHACIAMEPLAWNLHELSTRSMSLWPMPPKLCKNIVRQLLVVMDGIHRDMGIILVDLKPDNILIRPQEVLPIILDELISEPFEVRIEDPEDYPVGLVRYDSLPLPPTRDASQYNLVDPLEIAIVDFGRARKPNQIFPEDMQHLAYRAPEVYLGYPCDTSLDIWAFACVTFWLVTGIHAFDWRFGGRIGDIQLGSMADMLERKIPMEMREKSQHWHKYLDEDGNFLHYRVGSQERNLRDEMVLNLGTLPEFPAEEVEGWHKFLLRCFQFHPEARPTAAELLQDPWLTED